MEGSHQLGFRIKRLLAFLRQIVLKLGTVQTGSGSGY